MIFSENAVEWLSRTTGIAHLELDIEKMKGAYSSHIFLVQSTNPFFFDKFVLRVLYKQDWLTEEPDLPIHEASALKETQKAGLNAPKLIDFTPNDIGFGGPVVLMSYLDGEVEILPKNLENWLDGLAKEIVNIHRHKAEGFGWEFSSWVDRSAVSVPEWTSKLPVWERAIEIFLNTTPDYPPVFIHRDYHPANVLWKDGLLTGTVDWINACLGPAEVDIANCRTDLVQMYGFEVADQFLAKYLAQTDGFQYNHYWDLDSIFNRNLPEPEFYSPWQEFGLEVISLDVLKARIDEYLEVVVKSLDVYQTRCTSVTPST